MFKDLKVSLLLVSLALVALAALPAYPLTETASVKLSPSETENTRTLLGENPDGMRANPSRGPNEHGSPEGTGTMIITIPKLGLDGVQVPTSDTQIELDREGIIHLDGTGAPWKEGSNTVIVGHALGFLWTKVPYVFYKLDELEPGDEILVTNHSGKRYTFEVYDYMTVKPEDFWVTYPVSNKTVLSLQTCTPIPTFENRLIVRAELVA